MKIILAGNTGSLSAIYCIKNIVNGKTYIGSAVEYKGRWRAHLHTLRKNKHPNSILQRSWNKYGELNFVFQIIEPVVDEKDLIKREQYYIDTLKPVYNLCLVAGSQLGQKRSKECREKMSLSRKGVSVGLGILKTEAHKKNMSLSKAGIKLSDSARAAISRSLLGNSYRKGKPSSEATKEKNRIASTGRVLSMEARAKISLKHKGKIVSEETKRKKSESSKGQIPWNLGVKGYKCKKK